MKLAPEHLYVNGELLPGKAVLISDGGTIIGIEDSALHPDATRLPGRALFPGLVNAHSHAFQYAMRGAAEAPGDFWSWRDAMYQAATQVSPEGLYDVALRAFREMLQAGITTVGEFHYIHRDPNGQPYSDPNRLSLVLVEAARAAGIRICLLRSAYARSGFEQPPDTRQRRFIEPAEDFIANTADLRAQLDGVHAWVGVAPHSIRAVPLAYLRRVADFARSEDLPIHIHAAEQPAELAACRAEYGLTPIALLSRERILSPRCTVVHGIHVSDEEIRQLAGSGATVCACPSTERNLGDGTVPADRLLQAGVPIALGTDSQAQIDLLDDARQLEYHLRLQQLRRGILDPRVLLECATIAGVRSLGCPEAAADFLAIDERYLTGGGVPVSVFTLQKQWVRDVFVAGRAVTPSIG